SKTRNFAGAKARAVLRIIVVGRRCLRASECRPASSREAFACEFGKCYRGTMSIVRYQGVDRYVGNTPLIRLRHLSELTGCEILGKAEFMNPGGSVKDRAAYGIITDAEQQGLLK